MADSVTEILLRARGDFSDLTGKISGLRKEFQNLKLPKDITANLEKGFNRLDPILKSYQKQLDKGFKTKTDLKNFEATRHELDAIFSDITSEIQKVNGQPVQLKADLKEITALEKKLDGFGEKLQKALDKITIKEGGKVTNEINKLVAATSKASTIKPMTIKAQDLFNQQDFVAFNNEIDKIQNKILNLSNVRGAKVDLAKAIMGPNFTNDVKAMDDAIKRFFNDLKVSEKSMTGLAEINNDITKTGQALNQVKTDSLTRGVQALSDFGANAQQASQQAKGLGDSIDGAASSSVRMADELQQLKTSTQYFFSLRNMINLFKRGVSEAVDVIKELDAAMTETAVVTDFSVGDMWKKLPEYTANANALGASVKDMYEATTLYYQQGLETNAAMGIANETMKMARIGGLEAADATDKMTAALRGFNMTLDEASAQRVNDVYSNLAAKTASDTEELGTAMQRTASIAASAGMSFEGTAAFLAQAIETTREPAENLGTAMKTIVARFTELKKNPLEITEVDGEEVDYNKVDTALKSIGVSLKDANGQFRNLDQVFLDIAQRWDGLTQTQQRYVATTAAGSRQQSRFIAMMSNYERTVELMDYANNSAGASNEQFGKTMESLEAKLNKLRNAWNEFLMGIMNDSMTKFVVDAGTKLLDLLNNITDALSFGGQSGLLKSITSLTAAFIGLKTAGKLINFGVDKAGSLLNPNTPLLGFGGDHGEKVSKTTTTIVNPIVAEIRQVVAAIKGQSVVKAEYDKIGTVQQYKNSQASLRTLLGLNDQKLIGGAKIESQRNIKYSEITDNLKSLSGDQQRQLLGTLPGLQQAMRGATLDLLKNNNVSKNSQKLGQQITRDIIQGMNKGTISVEKGIDLLRNPQKWGQTFGNKFNEGNLQEIANSVTKPEFNKLIEEAQDKYAQAIYRGQNADRTWLTDEEITARQADFEKYAERKSKDKAPIEDIDYTKYSQLGDKIGQVGANFAVAGQSVQQFGITLSNLGLEKAGALLMQIGSSISSLGMAFNGLGTALPKIQERFADAGAAAANAFTTAGKGVGGVASGGGAFFSTLFGSGAAAAAVGVGVAIVAATAIQKYLEKKAKEAGEEVRKQFEEKFIKANEKISSLEGYESRFNELSKGVDQFGHNISLTSEEYSEYLSISRELQQLSPSLIAGYNAEGEAIIKKGSAIQDVINKLKEEKQAELDLFTSNTSIDKLIGEYQTSNAYKEYNWNERGHITRGFEEEKRKISKLKDNDLDFKIVDAINQLSGWSLDSLNNLTTAQLSWLSKHYNDVINLVEEQNGALEDEVREGYVDAFTNAGSAINEVMTEGKPIIDAMQMWMGNQKIDAIGLGLGEEFSNSFNQGVEGIMVTGLTEGWTSDQFKTNLKDYANEWKRLAGPTSQYANILADADEIQQQYLDHIGETGAIADYENNVEGLALQLERLAEQYKGTGAAGEAFAEQCIAQAGALRNYATEGALSLGEALNSLSDEFTSARGAKERFDKAVEGGDYYTAAEGYKGIIDTMLDDKNLAGDGSLTFWAGADELLGQNYVDTHSYDDIVKQINRVKGAFEDGSDGIVAFNNYLTDMWYELGGEEGKLAGLGTVGENGFEFNLQNEDLEEYAELLGISEDALASLIDKARQWVPINLGDPAKIRQALEASETSMAGTSSAGESLVYTSESSFRAEARQQGIRGDDYTKTKADAESQGVRFLTVENLTAKNGDGLYADKVLENIGLKGADKTLENSVAALAKMGFDLEDTKQILTADGIKLADGAVTDDQVEQAYNEQAYAMENPTVSGIASNTDVLVSNTSAMLAAMGVLTSDAKKDIENNTSSDMLKGYQQLLNPEGGFKNSTDRNAAREQVQSKIDEYEGTLSALTAGGLGDTPEAEKLRGAIEQLTTALSTEESRWSTTQQEASSSFGDISYKNPQEQEYVNTNAVDIQAAMNTEDLTSAAEALRAIEDAGQLSHGTMVQLAADFLNLKSTDIGNLSIDEFNQLATTLGLTSTEAAQLLSQLGVPFVLEGKITGDDLVAYINNYNSLSATEKKILLNTEISGEEKVSQFLDEINEEFGDGSVEQKTAILQAEVELANGDQNAAEQILQEAGFNEGDTVAITQKLSITTDGSVVDMSGVQAAIDSQATSLNLGEDIQKTLTINPDAAVAEAKIADLQQDGSKNIRINAVKGSGWNGGGWGISVSVTHNKRGQNYSIPAPYSPTYGAAAQGYNIPKNKKSSSQLMTSLVGEEGFEIGYIPSEARSVIFGAKGPEITSFPKDTVIYPHEQSKKILQRGKGTHSTLGSFAGGKDSISSGGLLGAVGWSSSSKKKKKKSSSSGSSSGSSSSSSSSSSGSNETHFSIEEVVRFNLDKKIEAMTSKIKKLTEEIDKDLKRIGTTALDITDSTQEQIKNLKLIKSFNDSLVASYQKDLNALDLHKYMMNVSYTDENGDKQDYSFDAQWYLYQSDGQYYINDSYIRQLSSPAQQKAVFDAVKGALDPLVSGLQKAKDAADDAQKQIEDLAEKFADTFYGWKNELTEIYDLTQRIENETSFTDRFASQIELDLSRLGVGLGKTSDAISNVSAVLNRNNQTLKEQIANQMQLIDARKRELDNALSAQDELDKIEDYRNSEAYTKASDEQREAVIKKLTDEYDVAANALAYVTDVVRDLDGSVTYNIDWEGFEEANRQNPLNKETYDALKSYLDDLNSAATDFNGSVKDQTDLLKQTYDDLKKYQDTIVDFEGALLKGVEDQLKNETENAKNLSDSISNALKDLLDEVKRKLDERRKQEDNAKTERDIAQKQQRLAALRANTSGGNQVEIAQLEKEIADAQQSYGRTLEDQLLDRLQQQGDEAKLQRERQIELAEASNEIGIANNRALVSSWLQKPELYQEQMKEAWLESQGYDEKGYAEQKSLLNQWEVEWTNFLTAVEQTGFNESTENIEKNTYTLIKLLADATGAVVDVTERNTETLKDLKVDLEGAKKAYSKGVDAETLKNLKFNANDLLAAGYTPSQLAKANYGINDLVSAGITDVKTLKDAGFNDATAIKTALGETNAKGISDYKSAGFTAKDLKGLFNDADIIELFDAKELKDAQFAASALKNKFNVSQLKDAGYDLPTLGKVFSASEFGAGGISYADAKAAGFTAQQLKNVAQYAKQAVAELQPKVSQGPDLTYGSTGSGVTLLQKTLNKLGIRDNYGNALDTDGYFGQRTREAVINFQRKYKNKASRTLSADGVVGYYTKEAFRALGYKTGGLADYTGPAWLDGTPSKPELVLNPTDTKNFLALRDVLSSVMKSTSAVTNSYGGDIMYDINIHVDKIEKDYDVDRVVDKVKKEITKGAGYRNVTQVRNFR